MVGSPSLYRIPSCTLPGAWQMAIDSWLLEAVCRGERRGPLLRFYGWSRPTLSLGQHQSLLQPRWVRLAQQGALALVRRPSGGGAVLHGADLTYMLIWPDPPRKRREAYRLSCQWLQDAFASMNQPLVFGEAPCRPDQANCFASSTAADLVHPSGAKRIGSAQRWKDGCLLQHGSLALAPDRRLWEAVFETPAPNLPALPYEGSELENHLLGAALARFPFQVAPSPASLVNVPLQSWEWRTISRGLHTYEIREGTGEEAADSAIALATGSRANPSG